MPESDIALLGGDKRTAYMIPVFEEKGYNVICYGIEDAKGEMPEAAACKTASSLPEAISSAKVIVGGIPFIKQKKIFSTKKLPDLDINAFLACLEKKQKLFAGVIPEEVKAACQEKKILCCDFMKDESIAVFNAVATAEGAILEALKNQETNLHKSSCLVLGYGRCGKVLAQKLKGLSADVTVCSRCRLELSYADIYGLKTLRMHELEDKFHEYEYIFNTVPAVIIRKNLLKNARRNVLLIDIASGAGGVDYLAAEELGIHALHCLGLPGTYAARISARKLSEFVIEKAFTGQEKLC